MAIAVQTPAEEGRAKVVKRGLTAQSDSRLGRFPQGHSRPDEVFIPSPNAPLSMAGLSGEVIEILHPTNHTTAVSNPRSVPRHPANRLIDRCQVTLLGYRRIVIAKRRLVALNLSVAAMPCYNGILCL